MVRVIVGIIMMPSATPPASAEKCFCGTTIERVHGDAHHDRGHAVEHIGREADHIGQAFCPAELRQVDTAANAERHADQAGHREQNARPTMAFAMPPPGSPTGLGTWVKNARLSEPTPL